MAGARADLYVLANEGAGPRPTGHKAFPFEIAVSLRALEVSALIASFATTSRTVGS